MKKLLLTCAALVVFFGLPAATKADVVVFQAPATAPNVAPGGPNQFDLDHYRAYSWSIRHTFTPGQRITGARLVFTNIRNWDANANRLFVSMLDYARNTTHNFVDSVQDTNVDPTSGNGLFNDYFAGANPALAGGAERMALTTLVNLSTVGQTIIYDFTPEELARLNEFFSVTDNTLAFGFDPDCHFWNNGIRFEMTTNAPVPEPATMTLLGTGLAGLYYRRRKQRQQQQSARDAAA